MLRFACSSIYVVFDIVKSKHGDEKAIANVKLMIAARKMHKKNILKPVQHIIKMLQLFFGLLVIELKRILT